MLASRMARNIASNMPGDFAWQERGHCHGSCHRNPAGARIPVARMVASPREKDGIVLATAMAMCRILAAKRDGI